MPGHACFNNLHIAYVECRLWCQVGIDVIKASYSVNPSSLTVRWGLILCIDEPLRILLAFP